MNWFCQQFGIYPSGVPLSLEVEEKNRWNISDSIASYYEREENMNMLAQLTFSALSESYPL